jgi:hypothetical protein
VSIDDQRDLYERLDRAIEAIAPGTAPVDGVMRRGKVIRWRRRSIAVAGVAAVVAAGVLSVPSLRHAATDNPATGRYTATVQPPGPHSPAGEIASGTVNGQRWQLTAGKPGAGGAGRGQQFVIASGPAFGPDGVSSSGPAFAAPATGPVSLLGGLSSGPAQAQYGTVAAGVSYVTVRLGNGIVLTLHPARVYGVRLVAFAIPLGAPVASATAYSSRGEIATAIPFNGTDGIAAFVSWLRPGQPGLARASDLVSSGSYLGKAWSARAYLGPWGACLMGQAGGTEVSSCEEVTSVARLGTGIWLWTDGVPAVAMGSAAPSVVRVAVTSPDGKTTQVHPVAVGAARFFAFPFGKGPNWKWTAYDGSGREVISGEVVPGS